VAYEKLAHAVALGAFRRLHRQKKSRCICAADLDGAEVYFILDCKKSQVVTILTKEQTHRALRNRGHAGLGLMNRLERDGKK
jgi:hypothetical protein